MDFERLFDINTAISHKITKIAYDAGAQNYDGEIRKFQNLLPDLQDMMTILLTNVEELGQKGITIDSQYLMGILTDLLKTQEEKDYILLADILELSLRPFLRQLQETIRNLLGFSPWRYYFEQNITVLSEKDGKLADRIKNALGSLSKIPGNHMQYRAKNGTIYFIEDTQNGNPVLHITRGGRSYYLHSNQDAVLEALRFAECCAGHEAEEFHIMGGGLFYHVFEIAEKTLMLSPIHVYEPDCNILALACMVCDFSNALNQYLYLHYDPQLTELAGIAPEHPEGLVIHAPSLRNIEEAAVRRSFEKFFVSNSSYRNQENLLKINFRKNKAHLLSKDSEVTSIDSILPLFKDKEIYIIAAGPSLDKNIAELKNRKMESIILAVGTVFYKLLSMGIRPDYLIVTDPHERVLMQIREHENEDIPMLLLSTACYGFIERYTGRKYLIMQKDFEPAESLAFRNNYLLFATGGSVVTTALDVMLRAGAGKIIFLGLDLAFTDNLAHAEGTSNRLATGEEDLMPVRAFAGGTVLADYKFIIYREWIEKRLKEGDAAAVEVINATEGGCFIEGMKHKSLKELV